MATAKVNFSSTIEIKDLQLVFQISEEDCRVLLEEFGGKNVEEVTQNVYDALDTSRFDSVSDLLWHIKQDPCYDVRRSRSMHEKNSIKDSWSLARSKSSNANAMRNMSNMVQSPQHQSTRLLPTVSQMEALKQQNISALPFSGTRNPIQILRNPKQTDQAAMRPFLTKYLQDTEMRNLLYDLQEKKHDKLLIILRGASGSGKTTLASIIWAITERGVVCSADMYFTNRNGIYKFERSVLGEAHKSCKDHCKAALSRGDSPVVIDNTNTTVPEMLPYVQMAVEHNYEIKIVEPKTEWKTKPGILAQKNTHGVPKKSIEAQLDRFEKTTVKAMVDKVSKGEKTAKTERVRDLDWGRSTSTTTPANDQWITVGRPQAQASALPSMLGSLSMNTTPTKTRATASPLTSHQTTQFSWTDSSPVLPLSSMLLSELVPDLKRNNNGTAPKPKRATKRSGNSGPVSASQPQGAASSLVFDDPAHREFQKLGKLFPSMAKDELEEIFNLYEGELDYCVSALMDRGLDMTGSLDDDDLPVPSEVENVSDDTLHDCTKSSSPIPPTSTSSNAKGPSSITATDEGDEIGAAASLPVKSGWDEKVFSGGATGGETGEDDDIDNESLEMILPIEFARVLLNAYGHPDDEKTPLSLDQLTVKVPVDAAFEIYKSLYLNLHKTETEMGRQNSSEESSRPNSPASSCSSKGEGYGAGMRYSSLDDELNAIAVSISQMELETSSGNPSLANIQDIEARLCEKQREAYRCYAAPNRTMAQNVNFSILKQDYPYLDPAVIDEVYIQCFLNVNKTRAWLTEMYPHTSAQVEESKATTSNSTWSLRYNPKDVQLYSPNDLETFERTYEDLEKECMAQMTKMRDCHDKCKNMSNPQIKAHYIKEANEINDKLKSLVDEMQYYRAISINARHKNDQILDLHGLRIGGAMRVLKEFLWFKEDEFLKSGTPKMVLLIITGQGKHSRNRSPILQPAVNNFLKQRKFRYHAGKPGSFSVIFTKAALFVRRQ